MSVTDVEHPIDSPQPHVPVSSPVPEVGEPVWVDPRELVVRANVRADAALDRDVADRGVRRPLQRRAPPPMAAVEVGTPAAGPDSLGVGMTRSSW